MTSRRLFSFSERVGILFTIEGAVFSLIAVTSILCFAFFKWLRRTVNTWGKERLSNPSDPSLFLNLMLADLIQAVGTMPNIKWISDAVITEGHLCTGQAAIKQVGIVGVSITSLAIAVHTFAILVLGRTPSQRASKIAIVLIWVFTALVIGIPNAAHKNDIYYGPSGFWCWIVPEWPVERIVTEYLWVWFAALSMLLLYTIMCFFMMGWIKFGKYANRPTVNTLEVEGVDEPDLDMKANAKTMLFFPAVYIVTILPNSISRWLTFSGAPPSPNFALFANTVFGLSGLFNVILFLLARPAMFSEERGVDLPETTVNRISPSISRVSHSGSSTTGRGLDLKHEQDQFEMQGSRGIGPKHQMSTSTTSSLPSSSYLSVDYQQYPRSKRATLEPSEEEVDVEEDCGHLPNK